MEFSNIFGKLTFSFWHKYYSECLELSNYTVYFKTTGGLTSQILHPPLPFDLFPQVKLANGETKIRSKKKRLVFSIFDCCLLIILLKNQNYATIMLNNSIQVLLGSCPWYLILFKPEPLYHAGLNPTVSVRLSLTFVLFTLMITKSNNGSTSFRDLWRKQP